LQFVTRIFNLLKFAFNSEGEKEKEEEERKLLQMDRTSLLAVAFASNVQYVSYAIANIYRLN